VETENSWRTLALWIIEGLPVMRAESGQIDEIIPPGRLINSEDRA
jgi:hypothetical protein